MRKKSLLNLPRETFTSPKACDVNCIDSQMINLSFYPISFRWNLFGPTEQSESKNASFIYLVLKINEAEIRDLFYQRYYFSFMLLNLFCAKFQLHNAKCNVIKERFICSGSFWIHLPQNYQIMPLNFINIKQKHEVVFWGSREFFFRKSMTTTTNTISILILCSCSTYKLSVLMFFLFPFFLSPASKNLNS